MSLSEQERALVRRSLQLFADQTDVQKLPFARVIPWLAVGRRCAIVPRLSERAMSAFRELIQAPNFSVDNATRACALARDDLLPGADSLVITVTSCPLLPEDASTTCEREPGQPGCDACAGRRYYAKTDGLTIWIAADVLSAANRTGGAEFLSVGGVTVSSLAEFVLLHEFAHVLQGNGVSFATATSLYNEARAEIPAALQARVPSGNGDELEFSANSFAYECTRSDRNSRAACEF